MNYYHILAHAKEDQVCHLATLVLEAYPKGMIQVLHGPQRGLVMLRVRETVANSQFNAGEILVTEVKLELDGQFGYGLVLGDGSRRAMAVALVDAAIRKGGPVTHQLEQALIQLNLQLHDEQVRLYNIVATTKVDFEVM